MKLIYILLLAAGACMSMGSCKMLEARNAIGFNDTIIKINQAIIANAKTWGDSLTHYATTGTYARLQPIRVSMENYITKCISDVTAMKPVGKGGEQFKEQELIFLKMERKVINEGFSPYEQLSASSTAEEIQAAYSILADVAAREQKEVTRLQQQQNQYAKDNNFKLKQKDLL